jgi:hypothetical protein
MRAAPFSCFGAVYHNPREKENDSAQKIHGFTINSREETLSIGGKI